MKFYRVKALLYRYFLLFKTELGKILDTFYWPLIDIVVWGFFTVYFSQTQANTQFLVKALLSGLILWTLVYSFSRDIAISFLDEMWERNVVNLFCSPLKLSEYLMAVFIIAIFRAVMILVVLSLIAYLLYSYSIFILGIYLGISFFLLIIFAYSVGILAISLMLRYGPSVEIFAWSIPAALSPISGVFYPVYILPKIIQLISSFFPTSYIFEGMRQVVVRGEINWHYLSIAFILNIFYLVISIIVLYRVHASVRRSGLISRFS